MATAQELVTGFLFFDSSNAAGATVYTVPAGKYAEIYIQKIEAGNNNGNVRTIDVGPIRWPQIGLQNSSTTYTSTLVSAGTIYETSGNTINEMSISPQPIVLNEGQAISHVSSVFSGASRIVCTVKEFNKP